MYTYMHTYTNEHRRVMCMQDEPVYQRLAFVPWRCMQACQSIVFHTVSVTRNRSVHGESNKEANEGS